jgi:hypothetical protein
MYHPLRFRLLAPYVLAGAAAVSFFVRAGPAGQAEEPAPSRSVYHADPEHLWSRWTVQRVGLHERFWFVG